MKFFFTSFYAYNLETLIYETVVIHDAMTDHEI